MGCAGAAYLLCIGLSSLASGTDVGEPGLMAAYGVLAFMLFLLSARLLRNGNWKGVLFCGAALTLFSVLGIMSVGLFLLPGSVFVFLPSAIQVLENRG